jgi:hypothetical protein
VAQKIETLLECDMPGIGHADEVNTLDVTLGAVSYQIELCTRHRTVHDKLLARVVESGRLVPKSAASVQSHRSSENGKIRDWAKAQGRKVSERGRIPADVVAGYEARNDGASVTPIGGKAARPRRTAAAGA